MDRDDFNRFLAWLCPNGEDADKRYIEIHRWLIRIFRARGCSEISAEEFSDETINRVVGKMPEIADMYVGPREPYIRQVAHYVFLERVRPQSAFPLPPPDSPEEKERQFHCLERCLEKLSPDDRAAVLGYYAEDKGAKIKRRRELSEQLGLTLNALRIHIYRIREALRKCITNCLTKAVP
jgi:DNA-directed RNA polymerase specialized sigma24 family protein